MEEVVLLSSDDSNPPSPELKESEESGINNLFENDSVCEQASLKETSSFSTALKRSAYHSFSSSDSNDSLPVPPSFELTSKQSRFPSSLSDDFSDIEEIICVETGDTHQNINVDSSSKTVNYSSDINVKTNYVSEITGFNLLDECTRISESDSSEVSEGKREIKKKIDPETRLRQVEEKEKRKLELLREKALKKKDSKAVKSRRPEQCLKYIRTLLDNKLLTEEYGSDILLSLRNSEMLYDIKEQLFAKCITWVKLTNDYLCGDKMKITSSTKLEEEPIVVVILSANEIIHLVKQNKLRSFIKHIASLYLDKRIIVGIFKLDEYYRLQHFEKQRNFKAQCRGQQKNQINYEYKVSQEDVEKALIEIQIYENCSHQMVETTNELGSFIVQVTKSLAEKDFKHEKQQFQNTCGWFAAGDSRDTVKVDKKGNGLMRLWKQQICQFSKCSIDTAEAIISIYPSPSSLIEAYQYCSSPAEGQKLLQDIPIRRGAGPLASTGRIGPELSKQMYTFFIALNGDVPISHD